MLSKEIKALFHKIYFRYLPVAFFISLLLIAVNGYAAGSDLLEQNRDRLTPEQQVFIDEIESQPLPSGVVAGVDLDSVDWNGLCANVAPVPLRSERISCPVSDPASPFHSHEAMEMLHQTSVISASPDMLNCELFKLEKEAAETFNVSLCANKFYQSLIMRAQSPVNYFEDFSVWRERYFSGHIVGEIQ